MPVAEPTKSCSARSPEPPSESQTSNFTCERLRASKNDVKAEGVGGGGLTLGKEYCQYKDQEMEIIATNTHTVELGWKC